MKLLKTTLITLLLTTGIAHSADTFNDILLPGDDRGNPDLVPVRENPGPNAETIKESIHSKTVELNVTGYKVTRLGYGTPTAKILVPDLAKHTLFNHRNDGEDAPCLAGFGFGVPQTPAPAEITIKISNEYRINREKKICQVFLVEDVDTTMDGQTFFHTKVKDMGFRYIGDCPASE